jgi:hypothetical protein
MVKQSIRGTDFICDGQKCRQLEHLQSSFSLLITWEFYLAVRDVFRMIRRYPDMEGAVALSDGFYKALGAFHMMCSALDLTVDFAIAKFLNVPAADAHLITSGMMFGKKGRLLADLIGRSNNTNKAKFLGALNAVRATRRDVLTHSYIWSDQKDVKFIERSIGGEFKAFEHAYTLDQLKSYVSDFAIKAADFHEALGVTREELRAFANAALSLSQPNHPSNQPAGDNRFLATNHNILAPALSAARKSFRLFFPFFKATEGYINSRQKIRQRLGGSFPRYRMFSGRASLDRIEAGAWTLTIWLTQASSYRLADTVRRSSQGEI